MLKFGQYIEWHDFRGRRSSVRVWNYDTLEGAGKGAIVSAKRMGWPGSPKWWQWWRRRDTNITELEVE